MYIGPFGKYIFLFFFYKDMHLLIFMHCMCFKILHFMNEIFKKTFGIL